MCFMWMPMVPYLLFIYYCIKKFLLFKTAFVPIGLWEDRISGHTQKIDANIGFKSVWGGL